jgi:hypothetical protein
MLNLFLFVAVILGALDSFAGFDAAFVNVQLSPMNEVYVVALTAFAWLVLAPYQEAANFLLYTDARTRLEGLDLQFRVRRAFPTVERRTVGALALAAAVFLLGSGTVGAAETRLDAVKALRAEVGRVLHAVEATAEEDYSGARWDGELTALARRLEAAGGGRRFDWFREAVADFGKKSRTEAAALLLALDARLAIMEESLTPPSGDGAGGRGPLSRDEVRGRLQRSGEDRPPVDVRPDDDQIKTKEDPKKADEKQDDVDDGPGGRAHGGPALAGPPPLTGCGPVLLGVVGGLAAAVLAAGGVLFFATRPRRRLEQKTPLVPAKDVRAVDAPDAREYERPAAELWREAERLAAAGQHLPAVRVLYLATLSALNRRGVLRCEPTRTNGEYVQQVRLQPQAPSELHVVFEEFTGLFERKWYGDRACEAEEFRAARRLAEEVQRLVAGV